MTITLGPVRLDNIDVINASIVPSSVLAAYPRLILELYAKNSDGEEFKGFCTFTTKEMITIGESLLS